jgi:hypothetical protein
VSARLRLAAGCGAVGVAGLLLCVVGALVDPRQAAFAYLAAYAGWLVVALGALLMVMIAHVSGAAWFVVLRRAAEAIAATLPLFALLFLPLLLALPLLYPWARPPAALDAHLRGVVDAKRAYLNVPFFVARAVLYTAVWVAVEELLRRWSLRQDARPDEGFLHRQRALAAVGLPPIAFALTWAGFDWVMSIQPEWVSTMFGVYWFAGGFVAALGLIAVVGWAMLRTGALAGEASVSHFHALGKLLLTFVIFWAYVAYSQYFIVWIADVPAEASWYARRVTGAWRGVALALALGHFALPFAALLSWRLKRRPAALAAVGAWLVLLHLVDSAWLVLPAVRPRSSLPHWLDLAAFAGVGGAAAAFGLLRAGGEPPVPVGDPQLPAAREYETR